MKMGLFINRVHADGSSSKPPIAEQVDAESINAHGAVRSAGIASSNGLFPAETVDTVASSAHFVG
jgi:hypothetical protein